MVPDLFSELNEQQRAAVQQPAGPVLVLAGPGSGKTRLLVSRIVWLIRQGGIDAEKILAVTFTNKAAGEMRSRLFQLIGILAERITISTFHSFALSLLRKYHQRAGLSKYFSVCTQDYQRHLLRNLCAPYIKENLDLKVSSLLLSFSNHAMKGKDLPDFARDRFSEYTYHLKRYHLIDFDHILIIARKLITSQTDILGQYRFLYPAILVDEFQDTDPVQYDILYALAQPGRNIFVVADDDQSIYAWRGANPENIRRFMADFAIEKPLFLEINYRSGQKILDCANRIIMHTTRIEPGKFLQVLDERSDTVELKYFLTDAEEMKYILAKIKTWQQQGLEYRQIAMIYPFHRIGQVLEEFLIKNRVPYQMAEGRSFLDHPYLNKLLLYLRLVRDGNDPVALEELAAAELGNSLFSFIKDQAERRKISLRKMLSRLYQEDEKSISPDARYRIRRLIAHIGNLFNLKYFFSLDKLLDQISTLEEQQENSFLSRYAGHLDPVARIGLLLDAPDLPAENYNWIVYHADKKISYILTELLTEVLHQPVTIYDSATGIENELPGIVLEFSPLESSRGTYTRLPLYRLEDEKRSGSLTMLFKFLQWYISRGDTSGLKRYVVLDLETTGKDPITCAVVEFAAVLVEDGRIVRELSSLVNPEQEIPAQARAVHHIDDRMVRDKPTIRQLWPEIKSFIGQDVLIAHNGFNFDFIILDRIARQLDGEKLGNRRLDTLAVARNIYSSLSNSIDSLMERLQISGSERHRALGDVYILAEIFKKLQQEQIGISHKLALEPFLDYVALGNFLENRIEKSEDRIFFINGARKLITPYSRLLKRYSDRYLLEEKMLQSEIRQALSGLNPYAGNFSGRDQLVQKIKSLARNYDHLPIDDAIAQFLSTLSLSKAQDELENINAVALLTYHAAKGLEFEKVIIMGLENNNMPGFHAIREDSDDDRPVSKKLEEQRRLLYVGITRARSELILTVVKNRGGWQQDYSPFIKELRVPYSVDTGN